MISVLFSGSNKSVCEGDLSVCVSAGTKMFLDMSNVIVS